MSRTEREREKLYYLYYRCFYLFYALIKLNRASTVTTGIATSTQCQRGPHHAVRTHTHTPQLHWLQWCVLCPAPFAPASATHPMATPVLAVPQALRPLTPLHPPPDALPQTRQPTTVPQAPRHKALLATPGVEQNKGTPQFGLLRSPRKKKNNKKTKTTKKKQYISSFGLLQGPQQQTLGPTQSPKNPVWDA